MTFNTELPGSRSKPGALISITVKGGAVNKFFPSFQLDRTIEIGHRF